MSDYFDRLEAGESVVFFYILLISFVYDLVYVLEPSYGKMVIASYLLAKETKIKEVFKTVFLTSVTMSIGMGLTISLRAIVATQIKNSKVYMNILTYCAITMLMTLGIFLLV